MPSFFKKSKAKATEDARTKRTKKNDSDADGIKAAFSGDDSLLQLHEETAELLRLIKTPSKNALKSPNALAMRQNSNARAAAPTATPSKARMTIEVLDDDDDDDQEEQGTHAAASSVTKNASPVRSAASTNGSLAASNPWPSGGGDPFAFDAEESRVRKATDTFYPDTSPSKKAMDKQVHAFAHEQLRLQSIDHREQLRQERKQQELVHHQHNKLQNRLETSAIKIQARSRGFLCRKHIESEQQLHRSSAPSSSPTDEDQWHEVRDVERGEVWYYNARTGQSQWEPPPNFPAATTTGTCSLPELPSTKGSSGKSFRSSLQRASSTGEGFDLPPLSPSTSSACSSARSNASEQLQSRPSSSNKNDSGRAAMAKPSLLPQKSGKPARSLPMLQPDYAMSVPNPWDCDSVMGSDENSLYSERVRDDKDDEAEDMFDEEDNQDFSRGRRCPTTDDRGDHPDTDQDPDNGDWQVNDTLFLADGSRNSKLRDTIRNALYVSKFDSVSALIASNVVLRKKPLKARKNPDPSTQQEPHPFSSLSHSPKHMVGNQRSSKAGGRDIVLGKRDAPMFVAMLADDGKTKQRAVASPNARGKDAKSPKSITKAKGRAATAAVGFTNPLTSPPRIRDLVDPGFHDDLGTTTNTRRMPSSQEGVNNGDEESGKKSAGVCFNCWSSSNGRFCEIHRDPNENRKIKASESALMCANWDLDQLRRKYRAEEIQEVFMKQNASLRYDKKLKQYVTVVECKHPIYRAVDRLVASWNKTMRRKLHTRAWFRSFLEQLRAGRVPKADSTTPGLMKLKNTIQNNRWCTKYSDSVREFHPQAPVTLKNQSGQATPIPDVIMIHPANPQLRNWVLQTEYTKPVELYRPRPYELPPKRCVPMPSPSFLGDIPLPVPNIFIDCGHVASWLERLCARISSAALSKAVLQISACSPPPGFNEARRTKNVTPLTVMFATFGRKPTQGNVAVGGLSAELLIHMLVTTYIPAQFGNFVVFDRRAIAPSPTKDSDATFVCLAILPSPPAYVFRSLEHALNVRRPPCIILATRSFPLETEAIALENKRFPWNRPEQTGEETANGFRTFWLVDAFQVPDNVDTVLVQPNSDILSPNSTSMNTTLTTRVDRFYPFCIPTTKENTPIEFIHLLWIGQSSRNQPQVFTTLGAQQPGEFMKNSDPDGALGVCTSVIYRSWAFMQSSPYEEFVTEDGVAYWYDKSSGETFWTRPTLPAEKYRGKDGDVDGVIADGEGEVATLGVGAGDARYPQQMVRKYMTKSMEPPEAKERRVRQVTASAKKHDIAIDLSGDSGGQAKASSLSPQKKELERIQVPQLSFLKGGERDSSSVSSNKHSTTTRSGGSRSQSPAKLQQQAKSSPHDDRGARTATTNNAGGQSLDSNTKQLIDTIAQALGTAMPAFGHGNGVAGGTGAAVDMLQLGIGLGMGLGLRAQQQQQVAPPTAGSAVQHGVLTSSRSDRSKTNPHRTSGVDSSGLEQHDEEDGENDEDMSTSRSYDSGSEADSLSARSTFSTATSVDISPPPDEVELNGEPSSPMPPGHMEKKPGYQTHPAPGEGKSWTKKPIDASAESQTAVNGSRGALHQRVACLPKDFVAAVTSTKTCKMQANYLPVLKNTNQPRSVGVVRPRAALEEWLAVGYSPWSAGRAVFGTQFIDDLTQRPELLSQSNAAVDGAPASGASVPSLSTSGVQVEQREKVTQAMKESQQLEAIFSHCRHGKYDDVEVMLNSPDWSLHIDARDAMGNTLLSIACQNNNKRIAKLCMRRGADINTQNLNGQTVLHYCHEYGFHDLMDYLMEKGARDDIVNADGLTCYEGLNKDAVDAL